MGKWTLERWITIAVLVFTLGTNWQRILGQQADIDKLKQYNEEMLPKHYVSREVYDLNQQHLTEAINKLTESLEKLYTLERQTGEPSRVQRQFDK